MQNFDEYRKRCLGMEDDQLRSAAHESSRPTEMRDIAREVLYGRLDIPYPGHRPGGTPVERNTGGIVYGGGDWWSRER